MLTRQNIFSPIKYANFRFLLLGRLFTNFANSMVPIITAFAVLDIGGSLFDIGLVLGIRSLGSLVFLLVGGMLADRFSRSKILQISCLFAGASQLIILISIFMSRASIEIFAIFGFINGAMSAISFPGASALTPQTVARNELKEANALVRIAINFGIIAGLSISGMLSAFFTVGFGFFINFLLFILAGLSFRLIKISKLSKEVEIKNYGFIKDIIYGWKEFTFRNWVWVIVLQFTVVNAAVAGGIYILGPTIVEETIGRTAWGIILAGQIVGTIVGAILATKLKLQYALRFAVALVAFESLPLIALAITPSFFPLFLTIFLNGIALEQFGIIWEVSLQQNIPTERLAMVYSYDALGSFLAVPIGEIGVAFLASYIGEKTALLFAALLIIIATLSALAVQSLRNLSINSYVQN